jgi:hypothetical protein
VRKITENRTLWLIVAFVSTFLWISPSGFMLLPVGGDATRFGLGLMSEISRAAADQRVPLWNSLWGYGFPALAESQLGVFYPPHLILFALLPLEWAYAADRIIHALWAVLGCWTIARSLGHSAAASCLCSLVFVTSGFFLVHETHHWAWPTASWIPWIWWAMSRMVRKPEDACMSSCMTASICIAMPVLTGHFQMGFVAMVSGLFLTVAFALTDGSQRSSGLRWRSLLAMPGAFVVAAGLAAVQIIPTKELASLANDQRDWEYLSGFAAPPLHWLGLLLPGLGRSFAFWRPLLWDQFHTSPEELFFYVGLVPIWLAIHGVLRTFRADAVTRAVVATLVASLLLAAGPYIPGFSQSIQFPGFSYFRAPARWTAASTLALAILAAQGLDTILRAEITPVRSFRRFLGAAITISIMTVVMLEGSIRLSEGPGNAESPALKALDTARGGYLPGWNDAGDWKDWVRRGAATSPSAIPAYVKPYTNLDHQRFSTDRFVAYRQELGPQLALMAAGFLGVFAVRGSRGRMIALLITLMGADTLINRRFRSIEMAPVTNIASQSPVLAKLGSIARENPWPIAVAGDLGNLPMAVGSSPIRAYRTLDVPVMPAFDALFTNPVEAARSRSIRLTGLSHLVIDPPTWQILRSQWRFESQVEEIDDPVLWSWLTTSRVAARGPTTFALIRLPGESGRAWRLGGATIDSLGLSDWAEATSPQYLDQISSQASPLKADRTVPELLSLKATTEGPELWLVSQWSAPNWLATLRNASGDETAVKIIPMRGGWQGVKIPTAGNWTLKLSYRPASFVLGASVSAITWCLSILTICWTLARSKFHRRNDSPPVVNPI